jgi:hypothetical protein
MTRHNNQIARAALCAALLASLAFPLSADHNEPGDSRIRIQVQDFKSRQVFAYITPGETLTLPERVRVRLVLEARAGRRTIYPLTQIEDSRQGGTGVHVTTIREYGDAILETLPLRSRVGNRVETLHYKIVGDERVPRRLWHGSFRIAVSRHGDRLTPYGNRGWDAAWPQEMTRLLYRAILLREPDPGAWGTTQAIAEGGYPAVVRSAEDIAASEESRFRLEATDEQRLRALYDQLLDLESHEVDRSQWYRDLRLVSSGQIEEVVSEMVRSERFRAVHRVSAYG